MIEKNYMEELFQKFISNTITKKEYEILMMFIKDPQYQVDIKKIIKAHWVKMEESTKLNMKRNDRNSNKFYHKILSQIDNDFVMDSSKKKPFFIMKIQKSNIYRVVASIVIVFGLFYFSQNNFFEKQQSPLPSNNKIDTNEITLKLNSGNIEVISENGQRNIKDKDGNTIGVQKGSQLNYTNKNGIKKLVYNELFVPYGKQFDLVLSDGTKIKLNAGTSIKYPVQFIKGKNRKIYLKGEAYFDVAEDKEHPFIVNANAINVSVLGTQFNMSYYAEDSHINTVLVEGSVLLYEEGKEKESSIMLTPGHKAAWNKTKKEMSVNKVDTSVYTAWKDGILLFKNISFNKIKKKLERHFDITIENQFKFLDNQIYTASFNGEIESIEDILDSFSEDTLFEYRKENNKIIITKSQNKNAYEIK